MNSAHEEMNTYKENWIQPLDKVKPRSLLKRR